MHVYCCDAAYGDFMDAVYVINLARAKRRKQKMQAELGAWSLSHKAHFVEAVDGTQIDEGWMQEQQLRTMPGWKDIEAAVTWANSGKGTDNMNPFWTREMLPGEIGCSLSHVQTWRQLVRDASKHVSMHTCIAA